MTDKAKVTLMSFGFKYGMPNANYYFDVGFIRNPARENGWGFFSEPNEKMYRYVLEQESVKEFIDNVIPLILFLISIDQHQVFAFGCNAGRHRSYLLVEKIARVLKEKGVVTQIVHRDV
ncbi:MAG: hypothetical protein GQ565_07145 [Candidatus Aegiribacteria sp.]|nr:hypothetical protein [Candidatus Aegiribacteria sp.]